MRGFRQPVATGGDGFDCFRGYRVDSICDRLPPLATTGLHKGSIICSLVRQQSSARPVLILVSDHLSFQEVVNQGLVIGGSWWRRLIRAMNLCKFIVRGAGWSKSSRVGCLLAESGEAGRPPLHHALDSATARNPRNGCGLVVAVSGDRTICR